MTATSQIPTTMRGWSFNQRGSVLDILKLRNDLPTPTPASLSPNEVLVRVTHVSIAPGMQILMRILPHFTSVPWIPELEFSGRVVATGRAVTDYANSEEVFGFVHPAGLFKKGGVLAEYAVTSADLVVRKPSNVSLAEASGLPGAGVTSIHASELCGLKKGDKVLLTGASGGVGSFMVQYFRYLVGDSGYIVATCSSANAEMVKGLGADEVIDYRLHNPLHQYLAEHHSESRFDAIADIAGGEDLSLYFNSPKYLTEKGLFLVLGSVGITHGGGLISLVSWALKTQWYQLAPTMLGGVPRRYKLHSSIPKGREMEIIRSLVETGKVKPVVDSEYRMEDALEAYKRLISKRARGKVIIHV